MVAATHKPVTPDADATEPNLTEPTSLEAWAENPLEGTEWVDGQLIKKTGMTLTHSKVQGNLYYWWRRYQEDQKLGGQTYTEVPCTTKKQGRKPDVAYLTQELLDKYGEPRTLPQSFPLSAEVVSPTDLAIEVYKKAYEYLESGGQEVWLIFPGIQRVAVVTAAGEQVFRAGEVAKTQALLPGFSIPVDELLA
ncbi:MAG: Uma2 family endonuclease [Cyanobacteria bacterium J06623_5]